MDKQTQLEIEAAAWRKMLGHLQKRNDVQNIDLMNMAGFCRNCLSKWYMGEANQRGESLDYDQSRELVYGMPYAEYKSKYQKKASEEQLATFNNLEEGKDTTE